MNPERLFRDVEKRLEDLPDSLRAEVLDALREEIARDRRRTGEISTVQLERLRRIEAEALRNALDAINRHAGLSETVDEVLKQAAALIVVDSCLLAQSEPDLRIRIAGVRGLPEELRMVGLAMRSELALEMKETRQPILLDDVRSEPRFVRLEGVDLVRSWLGVPLLIEGEMIGLLSLHRHNVAPFDDEDLHRAKALAFSAAAAVRRAELLEKVRRYAALLENSVEVDQAVFSGQPPRMVARIIIDGAVKLGRYAGGALLIQDQAGESAAIACIAGELGLDPASIEGRPVSPELIVRESRRFTPANGPSFAAALGLAQLPYPIFVVPVAAAGRLVGALILFDPDAETPDDRLIEAYASRAAAAYLHSTAIQP
jgi:hypothetical protein